MNGNKTSANDDIEGAEGQEASSTVERSAAPAEGKRRGKGGRPPKPEGEAAKAILAVRVTPADEANLAALVVREQERLRGLGVPDSVIGKVTGADIVRSLIRAAVRATVPGGLPAPMSAGSSTNWMAAAPAAVPPGPARAPLARPEPAAPAPTPTPAPAGVAEHAAGDDSASLLARAEAWCTAYDQLKKPYRGGWAALAAIIGTDKSVMSRWKAGRAPLPPADRAALLKALRRSPERVRAEREPAAG